jgi:uncharacterized hydrophobic protein (TIGR00271 family)
MSTTKSVATGSLRRWVRFRTRFAHIVLLPDLTADEAHDLRMHVREESALSAGYILMSVLSAGIATLGLLQSSVAVVIGAMLVSPLMSPIAALGFGFASLDGQRIREAIKVVAVGAAIGILTAVLLTWLSPIRNATPEIIGRTQPTLLDLAIALLSGIAGGYATVRQKGGTAIGVAIATALMPPLAVVGYGLGTFRLDFAGGALLLFLTNLAAIAFAFAVIAQLSGAARPLGHVELTPGYIAGGAAIFLALATPLALTLLRVTHEGTARNAATEALMAELKIGRSNIAQLDVVWPLRGTPVIDAVVIAPTFTGDAQDVIAKRLAATLGTTPNFTLQQVVAADLGSQARAMIDTAMERTAAGIAKDVPPFSAIRAAVVLPTQAMWVNRSERLVNIVPVAAPGWKLVDYRDVEAAATQAADGWRVQVIPPIQPRLLIATGDASDPAARQLALWASTRWGVRSVGMETTAPARAGDRDAQAIEAQKTDVAAFLDSAGIAVREAVTESKSVPPDAIGLMLLPPSPSQLRAAASADREATRDGATR